MNSLLQQCPTILAINFVAQGMRGMGFKELAFRLLLQILVSVIIGLLAVPVLDRVDAVSLAIVGGHLFSFLANGQFWVCCRYCALYRRSPDTLLAFTDRIAGKLQAKIWLREALILGSLGDGRLAPGPRSDIDLRLVIPPGFDAWLKTNLLLLSLRIRAMIEGMPLDLYAYDSVDDLKRFRADEAWLIIQDRDLALAARFPGRLMVHLERHR
ncbi:MAG: hypothetical protein ACFB6S_10080 [Geminicoccaceae bacterium]